MTAAAADGQDGTQVYGASEAAAHSIPLGVEIGPARWKELRAVARVQRQSFRPRLAYGLGTVLLLWLLPHVRFLVARADPDSLSSPAAPPPRRPADPRVVGAIIGDQHRGEARVISLAVEPAARRRGIGWALLAALERELPKGDLVLMVEEDNTSARALYTHAGYHQVGVARDYYGRGRHGLWMQKKRDDSRSRMIRV